VGFALLCTMWLLLMGHAGVAERRPPHTPVQTILVVSNGIAVCALAVSIAMAVGTTLAILTPFAARSTRPRPPTSDFPRTRARKIIFWSVGFASLSMAWVASLLVLGSAGVLDRRPPDSLVTFLLVSFGVAACILIVSILGAACGIGLLFRRQFQEYLQLDREYRGSTERPPPLLFMANAVLVVMAFLVVLATPVMNYVQGACSSAWECPHSISEGWFVTLLFFATVLDWIGKRVMARRRSLPSSSS
jgi:hypothetical protein